MTKGDAGSTTTGGAVPGARAAPSAPARAVPQAGSGWFERIVEHAIVGIAVVDADGRFVQVNAAHARMMGYAEDELLRLTYLDVTHPDDRAASRAHFARLLGGEIESFVTEKRYLRKDGETVWGRKSGTLMPAPNGGAVAVVLMVEDITERRRAEQRTQQLFAEARDTIERLHRTEARLRLAQAAAGVGTWEYDPRDGRMRFSPEAFDLFAIDPAEPDVYAAWRRGVHPHDVETVEGAIQRCMVAGEVDVEYRYRHPVSGERWMLRRGRLLADGDGHPFVAGVSFDITEHRRLVEQLQEADRRKDEFLAMLAHELRNPLAPLVNAHRILARAATVSDETLAPLAMAERQTRQLTRLVDDLLEVSRITRGKIRLRLEPMRLDDAVRAAVESVEPMTRQRGQRVRMSLPVEPVQVVADPARVAQILENLLTNASKYTPDGGRIDVELEPREADVELRVRDTGMGIAPEKIPQLFELFSQLDIALDRSQGGLGIGLALVKRLAELHGGSVTAASDGLGKGATFMVRLPRRRSG